MSVADGAWPAVGTTGARFGSRRPRHRTKRDDLVYSPSEEGERSSEWDAAVTPASAEGAEPTTGGQVAAGEVVRRDSRTMDRTFDGTVYESTGGVGKLEDHTSSFVRPFVRIGGRTRAEVDLPLEALVSTVPSSTSMMAGKFAEEHRVVVGLCGQPRSTMEVAALAGIPLGVARVLIGDLAGAGILTVHSTVDRVGPGSELLERVLTGLHSL
ncbi:uncharacterized protein DUF742 [Rhodococcus sp. SMB37]|nr:uncharacterized protein DUF742 [Rhodococcus sp. SMB37]